MKEKTMRVVFGILIAVCLTACQFSAVPAMETPTATFTATPTKTATLTSTPTLTPTATATETPVSTATDEPLVCSIEDTLIQAKEMFPDRDVKFLSSIIEPLDLQQIALILVDPDIPLVTSDTQLPAYVDMAFRDALKVTLQLVNSNPCIEELFNVVDAVVVDQWHNGWVSVQWKVEDIPKSGPISESRMKQVYEDTTVSYTRTSPCIDYGELPHDACQWEEIEEKIYWHFGFEGTPPGTEFYLIIDDNVTIWAHWMQPEFEGDLGVGLIFASLLNLAMEGECLYPPPNQIKFSVHDENFVHKYVGWYEDPYDGDYQELDTIEIYPLD